MISGLKVLVASGLAAYDDSWDNHKNRSLSAEILYVILRDKKVSRVFSKPVEMCPAQGNKVFGGSYNGRCIVGVGKGVYEFREADRHWKKIKSTNKPREYSSSCCIDQKCLVVVGGWDGSGKSSAEIFHLPDEFSQSNSKFYGSSFVPSFLGAISMSTKQRGQGRCKWTKCTSKAPVSLEDGTPAQVWGHTITHIGNNKLLLVGGRAISQRPYRRQTTRCVLEGEITEDLTDIKWRRLQSISMARFGHFAFKLNKFIYIGGGAEYGAEDILCCEKYDIEAEAWSVCQYSLPYHLYKASAVVDVSESFALIIGGLKRSSEASNEVLLFTEEGGFEVLENSKLQTKRYGHVSLRMCIT